MRTQPLSLLRKARYARMPFRSGSRRSIGRDHASWRSIIPESDFSAFVGQPQQTRKNSRRDARLRHAPAAENLAHPAITNNQTIALERTAMLRLSRKLFISLALFLSHAMCAMTAYKYCELEWAGKYAGWSAPPETALICAIPFLTGIAVCLTLSYAADRRRTKRNKLPAD